ncbi:MAG: 2-oxoglutarate dehydrogenase [Bacteroidetes bacterium GWF2_42_66]|nr:MAG: 2-oxoglutarate dehydrogenase [Bacteroidetes bacterium GWA2_42_15]OFY01201.1 MAG: 2-oxoglutarate dehydrogenase [Bacteroidetes bacterium GWE2_42_39]OFY42044.1 MAG: 2-oxoglutarate dehydrogenase [Bacteroidetes bacterium GWF2_42_66]HBL77753.1 dihydrolipoyllysine-residue succinyltransferase [Prolixibacteraceae bacterium]HCB62882.1 dihydrolipoyllysine-residue succinyltransferase [Bacteroidales bacterium]
MIIEIKIPSPGESITEVELGKWLVEEGSVISKGDEIAEVESDKATLTIVADADGKVSFKVQEGERVAVGSIVCTIDTSVEVQGQTKEKATVKPVSKIEDQKSSVQSQEAVGSSAKEAIAEEKHDDGSRIKVTSVAQNMMDEYHLSVDDVINGLRRLSKKDVEAVVNLSATKLLLQTADFSRDEKRERMSALRRKLSERLVAVKNETAMLTTFNEIDMSKVMDIRQKYQQQFVEKHGFKLGFMSFFTKAVAEAIKFHPSINSQIDGDEILTLDYADIGIAVQTPKGLMVPIIRNAESKTIPQIELEIKELAEKARNKKISVAELTGGTFTITNGGTFGSLLSTPIINPPQSAILGMHNIVDRPVAVDGQVVIRPMMYVALSYDHRIIDGKDSVGFLVKVKQLIENPASLLTAGRNPEEILLGI